MEFQFSLFSSTLTCGCQHKQTYLCLTFSGLNLVRSLHKIHVAPKNEVQAKHFQDSPSLNGDRPGSQDCSCFLACLWFAGTLQQKSKTGAICFCNSAFQQSVHLAWRFGNGSKAGLRMKSPEKPTFSPQLHYLWNRAYTLSPQRWKAVQDLWCLQPPEAQSTVILHWLECTGSEWLISFPTPSKFIRELVHPSYV